MLPLSIAMTRGSSEAEGPRAGEEGVGGTKSGFKEALGVSLVSPGGDF
jgi:hypothetical protein